MTRISSGCVLTKVNNLFTCEKRCDSVEARKALLEDFTSKVYNAEAGYIDSDGNIASEEQYNIVFILSGNQKDRNLNIIHGNALLQKDEDEDTPKNLVWRGNYLAKKGYKIRVSGDNFEKDFYIYCGGNDKINFLFKKTVPEDSTVSRSKGGLWYAVGSMQTPSKTKLEKQLSYYYKKLATLNDNLKKTKEDTKITNFKKIILIDGYENQIYNTTLSILIDNYTLNKKIPPNLEKTALDSCIFDCTKYTFCQDKNLQAQIPKKATCL